MASSLSKRLGSILDQEEMSDVYFVFPSDSLPKARRIAGHKIVLSTGSLVFKAMFYGPMADKGEEVDIVDVSPNAFRIMLSFLYTDEVVLDQESAIDTMYAAKKYDISGLLNECVNFLLLSIDRENVVSIYENTLLFDEAKLTDRCLEVMDRNAHHLINTNSILGQINYSLLCLLLERSTFCAREIDIFDAVIWWSKQQLPADKQSPADIRQVLKDAFFSIRFPRMTLKEIVQIVVPTGLLEGTELIDVLKHFKKDPDRRLDHMVKCELFAEERRWLQKEMTIKVENLPVDIQTLSSIKPRFERAVDKGLRSLKFLVVRRLFLTKILVANVPYRLSVDKYVAVLRVIDVALNEILMKQEYSLMRVDATPRPARYELVFEPVELCPKVGYEIILSIEPSFSSSKNVKVAGPLGDVVTVQFDYYGRTFNEEAQIEELVFSV